MLVNNENSILELKDFNTQLYKKMALNLLKQIDFYKEKYQNMWEVKTGCFWYYFKAIEVENHQLSFSLSFWEDQLYSIHMNTWESTDVKDWNEWTEEKEMQVFHRNNKFLTLILGIPPTRKKKIPYPSCTFNFPWGNVWSVYDPRSASSFMGINYEEKT